MDFEELSSRHFFLKQFCPSFLERKNKFYSHFEEKGGYVWTTEELVIARDCVEMDIRRMVLIHMGGSNSHSITETSPLN